MTMSDTVAILESLNEAQAQAVTSEASNVLVLAGAGSGKTRVLVHRIAWVLQRGMASPYNILAVTFTNKAALEMRGRIETLLGIDTRGMWVGTFHGLAHRMLRAHWRAANLQEHFQILDSEDQYRLIKRTIKALELDELHWPPRQVQWYINDKKDRGLRPDQIDTQHDNYNITMVKVYEAYQTLCEKNGLVDFAELLLRSYELLRDNKDITEHYQQRFSHVLVDEFQDTNTIQYAWLRLLAGPGSHTFIVGDDDQSIYGWRGAKYENLRRFTNEFPGVETIKLEQNYRSTGSILTAANQLISHNSGRMGKELWTSDSMGEPISVYAAYNEIDEARFVISQITNWVEQGNARSEVAILYRSNAQSRILEEHLVQAQIPYRVYGGLRFFERAEIKDVLAYLRLVVSRDNDAAFERIVNTPARGIGARTVQTLRELARDRDVSLWQASRTAVETQQLPSRAHNSLVSFLKLIDIMAADTHELKLSAQIKYVIEASELADHYRQKEKGERGQARVENIEELITAADRFTTEEDLPPLEAFLAQAALEAGEEQADTHTDCVQLMTLHSAKGLEFPAVFICGVEEELFPHQMSLSDPTRLEEERRLCYVGITRAMQRLYLTYAERRRLQGRESYHQPSRFIHEIPEELLQEVRLSTKIAQPMLLKREKYTKPKAEPSSPYYVGQRVMHAKFGEGVVLNYDGNQRIQIQFENAGSKWLALSHAKLEVL